MYIPFTAPDITEAECAAVARVMNSGWLTTGNVTYNFEEALKGFCGAKGAVCVSSATAGLEIALRLCGIGEGDEVIIPAYTFSATAAAVIHVGATPVFADCEEGKFHLAAKRVEKLLTARTAAVIPVDIGGVLCDYKAIKAACKKLHHPCKNKLIPLERPVVIADAAHSLGAYNSRGKSGSLADITVFSFHATKNLTTAEGGALLWNIEGEGIDRIIRLMTLHGQNKSAWQRNHGDVGYDIEDFGYKCNLSDIQSAIGLSQLERYSAMLGRRAEICRAYDSLLPRGFDALSHPKGSAYHLYMALLPAKKKNARPRLMQKLSDRGICCNLHFPPLPMLSAYRRIGLDIASFPNAAELFSRELTLPLSSVMTTEQAKTVMAELEKAMG